MSGINWSHVLTFVIAVFIGYVVAKKWPGLIPGFPQAAALVGA